MPGPPGPPACPAWGGGRQQFLFEEQPTPSTVAPSASIASVVFIFIVFFLLCFCLLNQPQRCSSPDGHFSRMGLNFQGVNLNQTGVTGARCKLAFRKAHLAPHRPPSAAPSKPISSAKKDHRPAHERRWAACTVVALAFCSASALILSNSAWRFFWDVAQASMVVVASAALISV